MTSTILFITAICLVAVALFPFIYKPIEKPSAKLASAPILSKGSACVWQMDKEA